jgi:hypothetical protein
MPIHWTATEQRALAGSLSVDKVAASSRAKSVMIIAVINIIIAFAAQSIHQHNAACKYAYQAKT